MYSEKNFMSVVEGIARKAGEIGRAHFRLRANLPVEKKGHLDLVTEADKAVEAVIVAHLLEAFPDDGVFGEEGGSIDGTSGRIWVIDPIDGTFNFVRGSQDWAVSIGLYEDRRPTFGVIYAPIRDLMLVGGDGIPTTLNGIPMKPLPALDLSQASTGLGMHPSVSADDRQEAIRFISDELRISFRISGSATASLISVAMGETDGYVALADATWDVMAALPILANLGAVHTIDWDSVKLEEKLRFACGSEAFLAKIRPLLTRMGGNPSSGGAIRG